jgi:hypothetical protein
MPGPLEGHHRAALFERPYSSTETVGSVWSGLAYLSQAFQLDENLLAHARDAATQLTFAVEESGRSERLVRMADGCIVAIAHRDRDLANAFAEKVLTVADRARSPDDVAMMFRILVLASAVFEQDNEWAEWFAGKLSEFAGKLPAGDMSKVFLLHLDEMKRVVPLTLRIHSNAEAIASAAV